MRKSCLKRGLVLDIWIIYVNTWRDRFWGGGWAGWGSGLRVIFHQGSTVLECEGGKQKWIDGRRMNLLVNLFVNLLVNHSTWNWFSSWRLPCAAGRPGFQKASMPPTARTDKSGCCAVGMPAADVLLSCCWSDRDRVLTDPILNLVKRWWLTQLWPVHSLKLVTCSHLEIQNTQESRRTFFNWTKQDKMCNFSRKSFFVKLRTTEKQKNKQLIQLVLCQLDVGGWWKEKGTRLTNGIKKSFFFPERWQSTLIQIFFLFFLILRAGGRDWISCRLNA